MAIRELKPKEFYVKYSANRTGYEDRAKKISQLTLPYLFTDVSFSPSTEYTDKIAQSYCGRLLNTLKAKMGMSLLPPSTSSFRLEPDKQALIELSQGDQDMKSETYAIISSGTNRITKEIERQQIRDTLFDMLLQLLAVGSVIIEKIKDDGLMVHTLRNIAVKLDSRGEATAYCIVEKVYELPEGAKTIAEKDEYELYTLLEFDKATDRWIMRQSIDDDEFGTETSYSKRDVKFEYVGWNWTTGDKYHRPYAEDYYNDMEQFNTLSNLLTKGSVIASKVLLFVDERGNRTRKADVAGSENGDVVNGKAEDVTAFQLQKNFDFQIPMERLQDIQKNLSSAFLMNESVTRDAERVTKAEIQFMAQELESSSLSGMYSKLSKKVSKRIVEWVMDELGIKIEGMDLTIVTGLDALGRSQEAQKLDALIGRMANMQLMDYVNQSELIQRYAAFEGIDVTGLIKTDKEVAQMQADRQKQQAEQVGADEVMKGAAKTATGQ